MTADVLVIPVRGKRCAALSALFFALGIVEALGSCGQPLPLMHFENVILLAVGACFLIFDFVSNEPRTPAP